MLHVVRRHVDEDVEASQRGGRSVDQRGASLRLGEVGLQHRGSAAGRHDDCRRLVGFGLRTRIAEGDVDTAGGKLASDHDTNTFTASDQRRFVSEEHEAGGAV
jgi:hypothetical protein